MSWILLFHYLWIAQSFMGKGSQNSQTALPKLPVFASKDDLGSSALIKLPIVQIVRDNTIIAEFVMGNDYERSKAMFSATCDSLLKDIEPTVSATEVRNNAVVDNVYSDDHLYDILARPQVTTVFKMYRYACDPLHLFFLLPIFYSIIITVIATISILTHPPSLLLP